MLGAILDHSGVRYDPDEHFVRETAFASYLRRHLRCPELFTYFHGKTGNWVLAEWIGGKWARLKELVLLGRDEYPHATRDMVFSLETMLRESLRGQGNRARNHDTLGHHDRRCTVDDMEYNAETEDCNEFLRRRHRHETKHFAVS